MERSWWGKFLFLIFCVALSAIYVTPTVGKLDLEKTRFPFKQKINLGLDLQGGLYMVLGVDFNQVFRTVLDRQASSLQERLKEKGVSVGSLKVVRDGQPEDDAKIFVAVDPKSQDAVRELVKAEYWTLRLTGETGQGLEYGLSREFKAREREQTIDRSIEVIRNRIDQFGVAEPTIASQGTDRIVVELPGVKEVDRAKDLIGRTAKLEFKIVDDKAMSRSSLAELVAQIEKENGFSYKPGDKFSEHVEKINRFAKGKIPETDIIAFERVEGIGGKVLEHVPYLVSASTEVTGDDLQDAQVQFDPQTQRPEVGFTFNPRGAVLFEKLTDTHKVGSHENNRLAIVLDNIVYSAPVIQSRIGSSGRITLGQSQGSEIMKEAKDLAIVLRAGALPAQLEFLEQRVVGPSLGHDSIRNGAKAGLIGVGLVFLFTLFFYRASGAIAVFSLVLNLLFVLAILVGLEATLTLPGIAGIALTIGIAVDSNVVIYERIREELLAGKSVRGAVDAGFQKAFRTIMDANVTNAAAAIVLLVYGTGPIKGFAVTMLVGIVTTLFTAVFVCRLMFDLYMKRMESRPNAALSI